jgi:N-acetyltransferase
MTVAPDGRSLVGRTVRLDAASDYDADDLFAALDRDEVWAGGYANGHRPRSGGGWRQWMEGALRDERVMYVVRQLDADTPDRAPHGRIVGTSSLGDIDVANEKGHLGWTAYSPDVWGTSVNPECKLLLLRHAFEHCGFGRVKIRTDLVNLRSQAAIEKLGARREGVARRHLKRADGTWRDSVIYSVIIDEWPPVKSLLEQRLAALQAK